ncbi:MAG: ATP-dependent helicase [Polyangiaceae bacterium]
MTFNTSPEREQVLTAKGHVLVTGGPGCGKTTLALQKALRRIDEGLEIGQRVLFLSFSRAAVTRIGEAARHDLPRSARAHLEIQTFHSFLWPFVRGHGYLLGAPRTIRLLAPHDERARRNGESTETVEWDAERERLFVEEGFLAFDLFAPKALELLTRSAALRELVASKYPLIIVDEAQDTGTSQWGCIAVLAKHVQVLCLADLDQQIYEFRRDVSPDRIQHILKEISPVPVSLGTENNRSRGTEIVAFAHDILTSRPRGRPYRGVSRRAFSSKAEQRDSAIRSAVGQLYSQVKQSTGRNPTSVGYLTNWGKGVAIIAKALQGSDGQKTIAHRVIMDEAEVLLATRVVALLLEPVRDVWATLRTGLQLMAGLYRAKGNRKCAEVLERGAEQAGGGRLKGNARCPRELLRIIDELWTEPLSGNPAADWLRIRHRFETSKVQELEEAAKSVMYLMVFHRGRRIADALGEVWHRKGRYESARQIVEAAVTEDQILGAATDLKGVNVMTIHKSKGKEFDAVILLHVGNSISPFSPEGERVPGIKSRRLLRVGITRARSHVLLLTDAINPPALLDGHQL